MKYGSSRNRDWQRQMFAVQSLEVVDSFAPDHYTLTKFDVEDWGTKLYVRREYYPTHAPGCMYHDAFTVGVLGARKQVYRHIY